MGGGTGPSFGRQQRLSEITIEPITSTIEQSAINIYTVSIADDCHMEKLGLNYPEKIGGREAGQDVGGAPWPQRRTVTGFTTQRGVSSMRKQPIAAKRDRY